MPTSNMIPLNEELRLSALRRLEILDTPPDETFDRITRMVAKTLNVPGALISLVDSDRVWFKSRYGIELEEVARDQAFCAVAILSDEPFVLSDVNDAPEELLANCIATRLGLRFYAGVPLQSRGNFNIGALCAVDTKPRIISDREVEILKDFAQLIVDHMELHRAAKQVLDLNCEMAKMQEQIQADIVEQRALAESLRAAKETAESAERAKSEFLAVVSHEIRTPLNGVLGFTRLLSETQLTERQAGFVEKIDTSAQALSTIIDDILDYSKIEAGKLKLEASTFPVRSLVDAVNAANLILAEQKGLSLRFELTPDSPTTIVGDSGRIAQVLINLVNNAIKFTESGEVRVTISLLQEPNDLRYWHFEVSDTGIGLEPSQIDGLFTAFYQAETYCTRRYGGTGLGLAICKHLVGLMGGNIWVESKVKQGSTFHFTLPLEPPYLPERRTRELPVHSEVNLAGRRVLIVDDHSLNRELVTEFLQMVGISVGEAADGLEALDRLDSEDYDAVLMDVQMPLMGGLEATREIRRNPRFGKLPIIALTAHAQEQDRLESLAAGMNEHLTKPIIAEELYAMLRRVLDPNSPEDTLLTTSAAEKSGETLDLEIALKRLGGKRARLTRVLRSFLHDAATTKTQLPNLLKQGNYGLIAGNAHRLKSTLAYLGAETSSAKAGEIERSAREENAQVLEELMPPFCENLEKLELEVRDVLRQQPSLESGDACLSPLIPCIESTIPLVLQGDFEALGRLETIATELAGGPFSELAENALKQFEDINVGAAVATLQNLLESVKEGELAQC